MGRDFDGSTGYLEGTTNTGISGDTTFSISSWFNTDTVAAAGNSIAAFGNSLSALAIGSLVINITAAGISLEFAGGNGYRISSVLSTLTNYHALGTKAAGAINTTSNIYLDGTLQSVGSSSTNTPNITNGVLKVSRFGTSGLYFNGRIGHVVVWNVVLTQNEATALAHGINPITIRKSNMVGWYELYGNDSPEADFAKLTGNGTISGTANKYADFPIEHMENYI